MFSVIILQKGICHTKICLMKLIIRFLIKVATVIALSYILPELWSGFSHPMVSAPLDAVKVALVLSLLNTFVKPVLQFFALPITCLTMGLFTLVISAAIVMMTQEMVNGFHVGGWLAALLFSLSFSFVSATVEKFIVDEN